MHRNASTSLSVIDPRPSRIKEYLRHSHVHVAGGAFTHAFRPVEARSRLTVDRRRESRPSVRASGEKANRFAGTVDFHARVPRAKSARGRASRNADRSCAARLFPGENLLFARGERAAHTGAFVPLRVGIFRSLQPTRYARFFFCFTVVLSLFFSSAVSRNYRAPIGADGILGRVCQSNEVYRERAVIRALY